MFITHKKKNLFFILVTGVFYNILSKSAPSGAPGKSVVIISFASPSPMDDEAGLQRPANSSGGGNSNDISNLLQPQAPFPNNDSRDAGIQGGFEEIIKGVVDSVQKIAEEAMKVPQGKQKSSINNSKGEIINIQERNHTSRFQSQPITNIQNSFNKQRKRN